MKIVIPALTDKKADKPAIPGIGQEFFLVNRSKFAHITVIQIPSIVYKLALNSYFISLNIIEIPPYIIHQ